jgi:hypothetical protein
LKPEWLEDERLAAASDAARLLSVAVILLADDHGRGRANTTRLAADVWGYRDEVDSIEKVAASLRELVEIGFLRLYRVRGQSYYEIVNWRKHQRIDNAGKPRVPEPSEAETDPNPDDHGPNGGSRKLAAGNLAETRGVSLPDPDPDPDHDRGRALAAKRGGATGGDSNVVPIRKPSDRAPSDLQDAQRILERLLDEAWVRIKGHGMGSGGTSYVRAAAAWIWETVHADPRRWQLLALSLVLKWEADPYLREKRLRGHPARNFADRARALYEDEQPTAEARGAYQKPSWNEIDDARMRHYAHEREWREADLGRPLNEAELDEAIDAAKASWPDVMERFLAEHRAAWERSA